MALPWHCHGLSLAIAVALVASACLSEVQQAWLKVTGKTGGSEPSGVQARQLQELPTGAGILVDDLIAGLYALICGLILFRLVL